MARVQKKKKNAPAKQTKTSNIAKPQKGLGKGLSALMSDSYSRNMDDATSTNAKSTAQGSDSSEEGVTSLPVESIHSGMFQPRTTFDKNYLKELADSIRANGIMQPIIVRPSPNKKGTHEIIAGERRWRASKMAGLNYVPVIIRDVEDKQALELALIENIQRQDLNTIDEAAGYKRLMDEFNYTQEALSKAVGKSRSHVANLLRLLSLPEAVQAMLKEGKLSMGHGRALLNAAAPVAIALDIITQGLNVRQTEKLVKGEAINEGDFIELGDVAQKKPAKKNKVNAEKDPDVIALEATLSENLGMQVSITDRGNSGEIALRYESLMQLDQILQRLGGAGV